MRRQVTIVYNRPKAAHRGEREAVFGVMKAVRAVSAALQTLGHRVDLHPVTASREIREQLQDIRGDVIFNLFEGFDGAPMSEAAVAAILEASGLPVTGCPSRTLELGLNKAATKTLLLAAGIATPDFQVFNPETLGRFRLAFPCIVKPLVADASHGITGLSVVHDAAALAAQLRRVCASHGDNALVETFVTGREFNAGVIGNQKCRVLPLSEIDYRLPPDRPRLLTYAAKWLPESVDYRGTVLLCPAPVDESLRAQLRDAAAQAYRALGCRGYGRVDLRLDADGAVNVIEVNPNPDISPGAGLVRQITADGLDYEDLIENILELAMETEDGTRNQAAAIRTPNRAAGADARRAGIHTG